jgi:hypothetical protein
MMYFPIAGDEILAVNGTILHGLSHGEAIGIFKQIRVGPVVLQIGRRTCQVYTVNNNNSNNNSNNSTTCATQLIKATSTKNE